MLCSIIFQQENVEISRYLTIGAFKWLFCYRKMGSLAFAQVRLRLGKTKLNKFILFFARLALTLAFAQVRLRLGNKKIKKLCFYFLLRSACTNFAIK